MSLKDTWKDKVNNVDAVDANDINTIAAAVIKTETRLDEHGKDLGDINGINTLSDSYAFTVLGIDSEKKTYTLDSVEGLEVGDVYSVHLLAKNNGAVQGENIGSITAISGNTVTVDVFLNTYLGSPFKPITEEEFIDPKEGYDKERNTFRIIDKPLVGTRKIGAGANANGINTQALSKGSSAKGDGCISYSSWGNASGKETKAGYAANARNIFTEAKGQGSNADGLGTVAGSDYQNVYGMYNIEDDKGEYVEIVGNGKDENNRSNARTLDWKGNAWFAGTVRVGKDGDMLVPLNYLSEFFIDMGLGTQVTEDTSIEMENYADRVYTDAGFHLTKDYGTEVMAHDSARNGKCLSIYSRRLARTDGVVHDSYIRVPVVVRADGVYDFTASMNKHSSTYVSKVHIYLDEKEIINNDMPGVDISEGNTFESKDFPMHEYTTQIELTKGLHMIKFKADYIYNGDTGTMTKLDYIRFLKK